MEMESHLCSSTDEEIPLLVDMYGNTCIPNTYESYSEEGLIDYYETHPDDQAFAVDMNMNDIHLLNDFFCSE